MYLRGKAKIDKRSFLILSQAILQLEIPSEDKNEKKNFCFSTSSHWTPSSI